MYLNIKTTAQLLGSMIKVKELTKFLKEQDVEGCAIMNTQLYQLPDFREQMEKEGLKAVYGLEVLVKDYTTQPIFLYAKNITGYNNLLKISSAVSTNTGVLPLNWLKAYSEHILAVLPMFKGEWLNHAPLISKIKDIFNQDYLFGVARTAGIPHENEVDVLSLASEFSVNIVAMHESYYLTEEDAFAYETLQAIQGGQSHTALTARETKYYVPTKEEMKQWFADKPSWLKSIDNIISTCTVNFPEVKPHMPQYPLENSTSAEMLQKLAVAGLRVRLFGDWEINKEIPQAYRERLDYELNIINRMGYADYFLIVADYMAFAKREGILTGPGRGSAASSLIAYSLQITQVDPLKYDLLFERFLNPDRVSLPDIDIDFIDTRRHEVIQYIINKYGKTHAAQICTFGKLAMKAAGRDVGRMLKFTDKELKLISTLFEKSRKETIQEAYNQSKELQSFVAESERNKVWFDTALRLEGIPRNISTHAAGVILTPDAIVNHIPLQKGSDDHYLTQWTMLEVEAQGALKVDLLGLRNLSVLEEVCNSLEEQFNVKPTLETIPLDCPKVYELLQKGYVEGVFQLEGDGMRKSLMSIVPTEFNDIIAINALYRPGPMEFIKNYAARKLGKEEITYLHPSLKPILEETKGIIVYQEQILKIAQVFAGFTLAEADLLRRAISKKKREVLEEQGRMFVKGAIQQGHTAELAEQIYALIVRFADYGFPKSHSTSYSVITYQMAYLKTHYPSHFYSVLLNHANGNTKKMQRIIDEMRERGIKLLPIELGKSHYKTSSENKCVRLGYHHIKGLVRNKLDYFLSVNPKNDFFEYAKAVGEGFDKETATKLIKAGAFDMMKDRATLLASVDEALSCSADNGFFGFTPEYKEPLANYSVRAGEIEVLGITLQGHPVIKKRPLDIKATLKDLIEGEQIQVAIMIDSIKVIQTKKLEDMAFLTCSDENNAVPVTVFPRQYKENKLNVGSTYILDGKVEKRNGKNTIIANRFKLI